MPARGEMSGQQWETVTFGTKKTNPAEHGVAQQPAMVLTPRTNFPGPAVTKSGMTAAQLENTDELKHAQVPPELKRALMTARNAKRMTQKELAQLLGCDAKTVQEYESGRAIPNNALIAKMERAMCTKLPRAARK